MTHMGQMTYLDRGINMFLVLMVYLLVMWRFDKFKDIRMSSFASKQTRPFIVLLLLLSLVAVVITDGVAVWIKYTEGWACSTAEDGTVTYAIKGKKQWSKDLLASVPTADAFWNLFCVLKTSAGFLLNTLFAYIQNKEFGQSPMNAWEFRASIFFSIISLFMVFVLQYSFEHPFMRGVVPQWYNLFFGKMFITMIQAVTWIRFKKMEEAMMEGAVKTKVAFYTSTAKYLCVAFAMDFFWDSFGLIFPTLGFNKIASIDKLVLVGDFTTKMMGVCFVVEYLLLLVILYPPKALTSAAGGNKSGGSKKSKQSKAGGGEATEDV